MARELQEILDSGEVTGLTFDPQPTPSHVEGRTYYNQDTGGLTYQTEITDTELTAGQEFYRQAYNNTGATIPNGTVVRYAGVHVASGLPLIEPALATTFINAFAMGVATHDIATGSMGFVTNNGYVHDIDLTAFAVEDIVFLSDTVAGELTTDLLAIPSLVGVVIDNGALGTLLVRLQNNVSLPDSFGALSGNSNSYTLTTSYQTLENWDDELEYIASTDLTNGHITIPYAGVYRLSVTFDCSFTAVAGSQDIHFQLWNHTDSTEVIVMTYRTVTGLDYINATFSVPIEIPLPAKSYEIRLNASTTINNFTFNFVSFDIQSIKMELF